MHIKKAMFTFVTLALAVADAGSVYKIKLYDPVWVGTTQLKAGEYTVSMNGDKAVFKSGKNTIEVPATLGETEKKNSTTTMMTSDSKLHEIDLAGTKEKIVFGSEVAAR